MLEGKQGGNSHVAKGTKLLETLLKQILGLITGYLLKAKGKMALGDFNEAVGSINKVYELDPKNDDDNILHALILSKIENFTGALNRLQYAISYNF